MADLGMRVNNKFSEQFASYEGQKKTTKGISIQSWRSRHAHQLKSLLLVLAVQNSSGFALGDGCQLLNYRVGIHASSHGNSLRFLNVPETRSCRFMLMKQGDEEIPELDLGFLMKQGDEEIPEEIPEMDLGFLMNQGDEEIPEMGLAFVKERPGRGFGKKKPKPLPPMLKDSLWVMKKTFESLAELDEPAMARAMIPTSLIPSEERLPSEVRMDRVLGRSDDLEFSIPMESNLVAMENRKRPGTVYRSLALRPHIDNPEDVESKAAEILIRKMPAWFVSGWYVNTWFGKGRLTLRKVRSHITVTNKNEYLTEAGHSFLDELDKEALDGHGPKSQKVNVYFFPRQIKLVPVVRSHTLWRILREPGHSSKEEIEVGRILLLGDIVVKDSSSLIVDDVDGEGPPDIANAPDQFVDSQENVLWKQPFDRDEAWSPHLTILAVSVGRQALLDQLRTERAVAKFNDVLKKQAQSVNGGVLFEGQRACWPLVNAVLGKDGTGVMNEVDRKVEQQRADLMDTIKNYARSRVESDRRKGKRKRRKRKR